MTDSSLQQWIKEAARRAEEKAAEEFYKKYIERGAEYIRREIGIKNAEDLIQWFVDKNEGPDLPGGFNSQAHKGHYFNDPVYGRYELDPEIAYLVSIPVISRLNSVKQLPFCQHVLPGAQHTRFEHMMGTYLLAKKFVDHFATQIKLKEQPTKLLLISCFVHDSAHGPLGHSLEQMAEYLGGPKYKRYGKLDKMVLDLWLHDQNEHVTKALRDILGDTDFDLLTKVLVPYIEPNGTSLENNHPEYSFLLDMTNSEADLDRMDYLARDTIHGKPPFWKACPVLDEDSRKLIIDSSELRPYGSQGTISFGFPEKIQLRIQELLRYRKDMYDDVYLNTEKIGFDTMICHALYYTLNKNGLDEQASDTSKIVKFKDEDLLWFLELLGPPETRLLVKYILADRCYLPVASYDLPVNRKQYPKFYDLLADMSSGFGFKTRVAHERDIARNLPSDVTSVLPAGVPPVMLSFPPIYEGDERVRKEVGDLEPTRKILIFTPKGPVQLDTRLWHQYANVSPMTRVHILAHPKLVEQGHGTTIKNASEKDLGLAMASK